MAAGSCVTDYFCEETDRPLCDEDNFSCVECFSNSDCNSTFPFCNTGSGDCSACLNADPYLSNNTCPTCDPGCLSCDGATSTHCLTCDSDKYLEADNSCQPCDGSCEECDGPANTDCTACTSPSFLEVTLGECITTCGTGKYYHAGDQECKNCDGSCEECDGPANTDCTACTSPSFLEVTLGECITTCGTGKYYDTGDQECKNCDGSCTECTGPTSSDCSPCVFP